jgi:hypothetical protein
MPESSAWRIHRARIAGLSRDRAPDDPELVGARRDLAACLLEGRVRDAMTGDHPLSSEQRAQLATLLMTPTGALVGADA